MCVGGPTAAAAAILVLLRAAAAAVAVVALLLLLRLLLLSLWLILSGGRTGSRASRPAQMLQPWETQGLRSRLWGHQVGAGWAMLHCAVNRVLCRAIP